MNQEKLELVADFYEFTMSNGYFSKNKNDIAYFDVFFRKVPDGGGYAIVAGLEQIIEFIQNLKFDEEDIEYLRKQNMFSEEYLNYLVPDRCILKNKVEIPRNVLIAQLLKETRAKNEKVDLPSVLQSLLVEPKKYPPIEWTRKKEK